MSLWCAKPAVLDVCLSLCVRLVLILLAMARAMSYSIRSKLSVRASELADALPQVRHLFRQHGVRIDRTERVANALGNLAGVATRLRALPHGVKVPPEQGRGVGAGLLAYFIVSY